MRKQQNFRDAVTALSQETRNVGWDDEEGVPIPEREWANVLSFYRMAIRHIKLDPFVSPCGDGSVHLSWTREDSRFVLELKGESLRWAVDKTDGDHRDGIFTTPDEAIKTIANYVAAA